jgi:hypothetical protein
MNSFFLMISRKLSLLTTLLIWAAPLILSGQQPNDHSSSQSEKSRQTRISGPKTSEGTIDYIQTLNDRYGKDVTPQNNSAVLMWQAIGPPRISRQMPPEEYFDLLGIAAPEKEGDYIIPSLYYFRDKGFDEQARNKLLDQEIASGHRPWLPTEFPDIADWLQANEKPLELMAEAVKRERYFSPLFVAENRPRHMTHRMGSPLISGQRDSLQMLTSRAMMHTAAGDPEKAWQDILTCFRLARHVGQDMTTVGKFSAIAIDGVTIAACLSFIHHSKPSAKEIEVYQRDLAAFGPIVFDVDERCWFLDNAQRLARGDMTVLKEMGVESPLGRLTLKRVALIADWEVACREGNEWFDQLQEAMNDPELESRQTRLAAIEAKISERDEKAFWGLLTVQNEQTELAGELIAYALIVLDDLPVEVYGEAPARAAQERVNLRVALALAAYRADNESYPAKLAELKPKYLDSIPEDSYSGKELHYRLTEEGYLLFSVGRIGKDDGGNFYGGEPEGDDLRIRMPDDFK